MDHLSVVLPDKVESGLLDIRYTIICNKVLHHYYIVFFNYSVTLSHCSYLSYNVSTLYKVFEI